MYAVHPFKRASENSYQNSHPALAEIPAPIASQDVMSQMRDLDL